MALSTGAALLGAAVIGGAGTAIGASKASKAANKAADLTAQANADQLAFEREVYNQTRADNAVRQAVGDAATRRLAQTFGLALPAASNPMIATAPTASSSYAGKTYGGYAGTSPAEPGVIDMVRQPDGSYAAPPAQGGPDWAAYAAENADVAAQAMREGRDPAEYAQAHYAAYGQKEGRPLPTVQANPMLGSSGAAEDAISDPTAPGGYMMSARPDMGSRPAAYVDPGLDLSIERLRASPDYEFRIREMEKGLGNLMSAGGGRFGGQRMKAAMDRRLALADSEFTDWRNFETTKYNADRAYNYGVARDAAADWERDRARSDGLYDDDRSRLDSRYDTRNTQLLNLAGFGAGATAANQSAAQSFASSAGVLNADTARARGEAGMAGANAWNQGLGSMMTTAGYLAGSGAFSGGNSILKKVA